MTKKRKVKMKKEEETDNKKREEAQREAGELYKRAMQSRPWMDFRLTEEAMNHLWDIIHRPISGARPDKSDSLAGNISKSMYIRDKDDWFYKNVLKECSEFLFYKDWINYYECIVVKSRPLPIFTLNRMWVNYQKQHEFNPPHAHNGLFSYVVFMKIPTHWKEQHELPMSINQESHFAKTNSPSASDFQFMIGEPNGRVDNVNFSLSSEDEGRMLFFPASIAHQVFPFFKCEEYRITISGNIFPHLPELPDHGKIPQTENEY